MCGAALKSRWKRAVASAFKLEGRGAAGGSRATPPEIVGPLYAVVDKSAPVCLALPGRIAATAAGFGVTSPRSGRSPVRRAQGVDQRTGRSCPTYRDGPHSMLRHGQRRPQRFRVITAGTTSLDEEVMEMKILRFANPVAVTSGAFRLSRSAVGVVDTVLRGTAHFALSGLHELGRPDQENSGDALTDVVGGTDPGADA